MLGSPIRFHSYTLYHKAWNWQAIFSPFAWTGLFNRKERREHREKQLRTPLIFCLTCQLDRLENCQFQFFFVLFAFFVVNTEKNGCERS